MSAIQISVPVEVTVDILHAVDTLRYHGALSDYR
jgi:hypothetical protein